MACDLIIKNGTVIDGTGAPRRQADIGITQGKITEIGKISGGASRTIDAHGSVVAPGFVDPHTHYDAQICWDPQITPSSWHGVTSVIMGNCGVGIAPCRPEMRDMAMRDLVNVEGIPYQVMSKGIEWQWETFPEYVKAAEVRGSALNIGFLSPLTPLRAYVMGEAAAQRSATSEELAQIVQLLHGAMSAGAFGFSTTTLPQHRGYDGERLSCQMAGRDELKAYANALKNTGKGVIEIALTKTASIVTDEDCELLDFLLTESGRPVTWLGIMHRDDIPNACRDTLLKMRPMVKRGGVPQMLTRPFMREISMQRPGAFVYLPCFKQVLNKSKEVQAARYASPEFRAAFREDLKSPGSFNSDWSRIQVTSVRSERLKGYELRTIESIARERNKDGVDTLLDLALEDDLEIEYKIAFLNVSEAGVSELLKDESLLLGLGDGGAHVDMTCDAGYTTYLLGKWVRERGIMSLESAVRRLTSQPADLFGIRDRGRLAPGLAADIVIFDPDAVGSDDRGERRPDMPGGGSRFLITSRGIDATLVNGSVVFEKGECTDALPGRVLRS